MFICRVKRILSVDFNDVVNLLICNNKLNVFQLNGISIITWGYRFIFSCMFIRILWPRYVIKKNKNTVLGGVKFCVNKKRPKKTYFTRIFLKICKECLRGINNLWFYKWFYVGPPNTVISRVHSASEIRSISTPGTALRCFELQSVWNSTTA